MRLLLLEDDDAVREALCAGFSQHGVVADWVARASEFDGALLSNRFDCVLLDLRLPDGNGAELLRTMRRRGDNTAVIVLTAQATRDSSIDLLNIGADDYMAKPFEVHELEARMRALLRRSNQQKNPILTCGSLVYDSNSREFSKAGSTLALTPREHAVLEMLMMKSGKTVSKKTLADSLFSLDEDVNPDAIEIYVHRIRKKLENGDAVIVTLRGLGYLLKPRYEH